METKKCKYCQEEITKKAKRCPKCGGKFGMPVILKILLGFIIIIIVIMAMISSCAKSVSDAIDDTINEIENAQSYLVLEEDTITTEADDYGFSYYINGYINNTSDTYSFDYVQVTFTTYDSEGNTIGTCIANNSGLEAGSRWKFSAICLDDVENIATYKMTEITGW